jgi:SulP family sulfate permease
MLKLGRYINLVPFPVISGFMSGIGVIIIVLQLAPLVGDVTPKGGPLVAVLNLPAVTVHSDALILGLLTLGIVYLWPARLNRIVPAPLLALIVGTVVLLLVFPNGSATRLGEIPTGFPVPHMPVFELGMFITMLKSALVLAALGAIDSLLTSLVADNKTRSHHDSDRELIGQGIGNTIAGVFGGLPGAGATMRTVVNIRAGGQTPISGALHALILLAIVLGAGSMAENIPHAVLAGILIKVGVDIIDWDFLKRLHHAPREAVVIMSMVLLITVFIDLIYAVGVGVVAASLLMVKRMTDLQLQNMQLSTGDSVDMRLSVEEAGIMQQAAGDILIYQISGPVSFGAAKGMTRALATADNYRILLLDLSAVPIIDTTSAKAVEDIIYDTQAAGRDIFITGINSQIRDILDRMGISDRLPSTHIVGTRLEALRMADLKRQASVPAQ